MWVAASPGRCEAEVVMVRGQQVDMTSLASLTVLRSAVQDREAHTEDVAVLVTGPEILSGHGVLATSQRRADSASRHLSGHNNSSVHTQATPSHRGSGSHGGEGGGGYLQYFAM